MKKSVLILIIALFGLFNVIYGKAPFIKPEDLKNPPPKIIRTCCAFGADIGYAGLPLAKRNDITSFDVIGPHKYLGGKEENNGIVYTRRGGFIDMGHLRDCADWTAYIYNLIKASENDPGLTTIQMGNEGGSKSLTLRVPPNLNDDSAVELAAKVAYDISVWHEISTWFGASYIPMLPERYSSFSPEDIYSNLLGTHLAIQAIKSDLDYDIAMTLFINQMLKNLEVLDSWEDTYHAMQKVDNLWYDGDKRFPNKKIIIRRFLETESALHPWLVPGEKSFLPAYVLSKPNMVYTKDFDLQIRLNYKFPVKSIFSELNERVITQKDFPLLIAHIQEDLNKLEMKEKTNNQELRRSKIKIQ